MGYNMKRGAAPKFKELGSSPLPDKEKGFMQPPYKDTVKGTRPYEKRQGYHGFKSNEKNDQVSLDPGYEDPVKIQKVQREGITPESQKMSKIAKENVKSKNYEEYSDLEKYDDDKS